MTDWINPDLDRHGLRAAFDARGHVRIHNVLKPEAAHAVAENLATHHDMSLICATGTGNAVLRQEEVAAWDDQTRQDFNTALMTAAREGQGFAYLGFRMDDHWSGGAPDTPMGRFYAALSAPEIASLVTDVTGRADFSRATAQATRFGPGHYLTRHRDDPEAEQRRLAFVWGFSPAWHPDWGGLLQFYADDGTPEEVFAPGFNTLDLFDIRRIHAVTFVTPFSPQFRQAVSGWYVAA